MHKQPKSKKPNVIWIFPDQLRGQSLACNGDPNLKTPHIDGLAARGINFQQARSGFPLCRPARGSILTGLYPHNCIPGDHAGLPQQQKTIAHVMAESGYKTAYFGKWHLDVETEEKILEEGGRFHAVPPDRRGGFEFFQGYQISDRPWSCCVNDENSKAKVLRGYESHALASLLIRYLEGAKQKDDPLFAVLSVSTPQNPYLAPEDFQERSASEIKLRENVPDVGWVRKQARRELPGYYAAIQYMDFTVNRIVDALDDLGLADNTYLLFFSDHGDMHGSHGHFRKTNPYEEAVRIPFIVSSGHGCQLQPNPYDVCNALVNHVDIAPTTLGLCNIPVPEWMQGFDYSAYARGTVPQNEPDSVFLQCAPSMHHSSISVPWRGIITRSGWKYVAMEGHAWQLYNLNEDPFEMMNLAHVVEFLSVMAELNGLLREWIEKTGDSFHLPVIRA